jgi:hypothetical protein
MENKQDHATISIGFNSDVEFFVMKNNGRILTTLSSKDNHLLKIELPVEVMRQLVEEYKHYL